ncbi:MAG: DISARM system SNF2-like helicase DrmD [Thermoanaerobaculia bacterium]
MSQIQPSLRSVLDALTKARLVAIGRDFGVSVPSSATKESQLERLLDSKQVSFPELLRSLGRDELKEICRAHGLDDSGRARPALMGRLLQAHGLDEPPPASAFARRDAPRYLPEKNDIVRVRHRQYLVEEVLAPTEEGEHTRVALVCLDDDAQGRRLEVLWELELGAAVLSESQGPRVVERLDPPRRFAAYLNALRWSAVTATDARLFQAPFRAGIKLIDHQLTPLKKSLELPRANLFIADDVGLGKTIEAGLVLQELTLRQRVDFVLIVCPAVLCLQWRDEMERRFGLRFEIYNRAFVARRRQERGFAVNPWATHNRFIISYHTLRRPEHRDPLLVRLGDSSGRRLAKSLLILDEAHTAAPSTASKYAIDSGVTRMVREVARRFENRLFLSATPHNGHSNSFSALLEILDPQRFTRGVAIEPRQLDPVMVRRLKSDLRALKIGDYPERRVVRIDLRHEDGAWQGQHVEGADADAERGPAIPLGAAEPVELRLAELLAEYTALMQPRQGKKGRLVFINLQKRLLSSVEAFHRTLELHARAVGQGAYDADPEDDQPLLSGLSADEEDEYGAEEEADSEAAAEVTSGSRHLQTPQGRARQILDEMLSLAGRSRFAADAKVLALLDWIRRHQCPAVRLGGAVGSKEERRWTGRRVIVFTEYADTKRYLAQLLRAAFAGTADDDQRILEFHGGLTDARREEIQRAWNSPPEDHPVRILLATDAAREGVNLQGACADLFHFDIPWNPARMEQRNGRIDRTLQSEPVVRCHYFAYPQRPEDHVLRLLVLKVDRIRRELGSLSAVVMESLSKAMDAGISPETAEALDQAEELGGRRQTAEAELEAERADRGKLQREIEEADRILNSSRKVLDLDPDLLRELVDAGLELAGAGRLTPADPDPHEPEVPVYQLPELPEAWQETLDPLRPPRGRNEPLWEWRRKKPQPVIFKPLKRMTSERVHLHLQHPFVQRVLSRFLAQGYGAHDLSRVTVLRNPHDALPRVLAFGRLSLFGPGAARLHDQLVAVAARWLDSGGPGHLEPFADAADREAVATLERLLRESSPTAGGDPLSGIPPAVRERFRLAAPGDFAALWPHIQDEADHLVHDAERKLAARGEKESADLRRILQDQRSAIRRTLEERQQLTLDFGKAEDEQRDQFEQDKKFMEGRLSAIDREIETEPAQIRDLYQIVLRRLVPVGLVYLWPETRG